MKSKKYHWQPEVATSIIYWSVTLMILFYSLTLALENTRPYWKSNLVLVMFFIFVYIGFLRWIFVKEDHLLVRYARFWKKEKFYYKNIQAICRLTNGIEFTYQGKEYHFLMRKKTCESFLTDLAHHFPVSILSEKSKT